MEHDGASVETISVSANSHGIRTLEAAPTAYLAMMGKVAVVSMNSALPLMSHAVPHIGHYALQQPSRPEAPFLL
jgi:hypothetical protein